MRVEVETDEALGLSIPRKFHFDWRAIEVVEIIDQWFGADHRYCKLRGGDGALLHPTGRREPARVEPHHVRKPDAGDRRALRRRHASVSGKAA